MSAADEPTDDEIARGILNVFGVYQNAGKIATTADVLEAFGTRPERRRQVRRVLTRMRAIGLVVPAK